MDVGFLVGATAVIPMPYPPSPHANVLDKRIQYADLNGLLVKTVRERCLDLPAAMDHPDVLSEMKRAQQRGMDGSWVPMH